MFICLKKNEKEKKKEKRKEKGKWDLMQGFF
jgi:hypothetical protein